MTKKGFLKTTMAALAVLLLSSCNKENAITPEEPQGGGRISFSIGLPKADPVTYAIHDAPEYDIQSLFMYEFDSASKTLREAPKDVKAELSPGTNGKYTYSFEVAPDKRRQSLFVFVANEPVPSGITKGSSLDDLNSELAGNTLAANSKSLLNSIKSVDNLIPMTGVAMQNGSNNIVAVAPQAGNVTVRLTRIVARIDVSNKVPNLEITSMKLAKTNKNSYLLPQVDGQGILNKVPTSGQLNDIEGFADLADFTSITGGKELKKAFYLYEALVPSTKEDALHVEITGTLGGIPVFYSIPFWKNDKGVGVLRNHLYHLVLGSKEDEPIEPGSNISFTIEDTDWNEHLIGETFEIMSAKYTGDAGSYDAEKQTLSLDKSDQSGSSISFALSSQFAGSGETFTATIEGGSSSWLKTSVSGQTLNLTVTANTGAARDAVVVVKSSLNSETRYRIKVTQAGV